MLLLLILSQILVQGREALREQRLQGRIAGLGGSTEEGMSRLLGNLAVSTAAPALRRTCGGRHLGWLRSADLGRKTGMAVSRLHQRGENWIQVGGLR